MDKFGHVRKKTAFAAVTCSVFLLLLVFYYHIDRYLNWIAVLISWIIITVSFILIVRGAIIEFVRLLRFGIKGDIYVAVPVLIYALTLFYVFSPIYISSAPSENRVVMRACYEGTQNQATLKFYQDSSFVLHWTGVFGYSEYFSGSYHREGDTLMLSYETQMANRFGAVILVKGEHLFPLDTPVNEYDRKAPFYLGYCRGLN